MYSNTSHARAKCPSHRVRPSGQSLLLSAAPTGAGEHCFFFLPAGDPNQAMEEKDVFWDILGGVGLPTTIAVPKERGAATQHDSRARYVTSHLCHDWYVRTLRGRCFWDRRRVERPEDPGSARSARSTVLSFRVWCFLHVFRCPPIVKKGELAKVM